MNEIIQKLPIAALVAICIFIIKELFELLRKLLANRRKRKAFRFLFAEEVEKNHWVFKQVYHAIQDIKYMVNSHPESEIIVSRKNNGYLEYKRKYDKEEEDFSFTMKIPEIKTQVYDRLLMDVADIDKKLFEIANAAYTKLAKLNHIRNGIEEYTNEEDKKKYLENFPDYAEGAKDEIFASLNTLYKECTNKNLINLKLW